MILINKKKINPIWLAITLVPSLLFGMQQPPVIVMQQQKTWLDYAFITATIGSLCFLGKYLWTQEKSIQKLKNNEKNYKRLLDQIETSTQKNSTEVMRLTDQTENIYKAIELVGKNISKNNDSLGLLTTSTEKLLKEEQKTIEEAKAIRIDLEEGFNILNKQIKESNKAAEKRQKEILEAVADTANSYTALKYFARYLQGYYLNKEISFLKQPKKATLSCYSEEKKKYRACLPSNTAIQMARLIITGSRDQ